TAEIWCHAPPDIVAARYAARATTRLPGHPGPEYAEELRALAARAKPIGRGPLLDVETTAPVDVDRLVRWLMSDALSLPDPAR
ncbi:transcriptional regulator, partial [Kaistia algarum]